MNGADRAAADEAGTLLAPGGEVAVTRERSSAQERASFRVSRAGSLRRRAKYSGPQLFAALEALLEATRAQRGRKAAKARSEARRLIANITFNPMPIKADELRARALAFGSLREG